LEKVYCFSNILSKYLEFIYLYFFNAHVAGCVNYNL